MPKVFVHGNPETEAIWGPLLRALEGRGVDDTVRLSPPGFGAPIPAGWRATPDEYVAWLTQELRGIDEPIDVVGHDWGAGHVFGLLAEHPEMVRSWTADCVGLLHPQYVWHDAAQAWQTPGVGEQVIAAMFDRPTHERAAAMAGLGLGPEMGRALAEAMTADMGRCILALYRAAAQPRMVELGQRVRSADPPPGLALLATEDPYVSSALGAEVGADLGAASATLDGLGHWWMVEAPEAAADALTDFWSALGG